MPLSVILGLCMGGVACFTPLSLYLFWLAAVNRRPRPTPVSGPWDFVGLLAVLGGFFLVGSSLSLTVAVSRVRVWDGHTVEQFRKSWGEDDRTWAVALAGYIALVTLAVGLTLLARRRVLVAYNAELTVAETALSQVLSELNLPAKRFGGTWSGDWGAVDVSPFHVFNNTSFRFRTPGPLAAELDRRLRDALEKQPAGENPAAPWIGSAAVGLFVAVLCCTVLIGAAVFFVPK